MIILKTRFAFLVIGVVALFASLDAHESPSWAKDGGPGVTSPLIRKDTVLSIETTSGARPVAANLHLFRELDTERDDPYKFRPTIAEFWQSEASLDLRKLAKDQPAGVPIDITAYYKEFSLTGRWPMLQNRNPCGGVFKEGALIAPRRFNRIVFMTTEEVHLGKGILILDEYQPSEAGQPTMIIMAEVDAQDSKRWLYARVSPIHSGDLTMTGLSALITEAHSFVGAQLGHGR